MKLLFRFFKDQVLVTIIYFLGMAFMIGFYEMTTSGVEVRYPVLLAVFFYVCYLVIRFLQYYIFSKKLNRLRHASIYTRSEIGEYQEVYDTINEVYQRLGGELAMLQQKGTEDKRLISAFIHNLKTPVTVSSLILQRVKSGEISQQEALNGIEKELERLTINLNNLLELQRLEELQNDYQPQAVDLSKEVTDIINQNKSLFINSHVYPKFEAESVLVYTDTKWNSVLINQIISNAVKYSADGTQKYVTFRIEQLAQETRLIIKDEGIGIPDYDLPKVFDAFFTGDNGRVGYHSSGVGLYLCKLICDHLGQKITIENDGGCKVIISYLSKL